MVECNVRTLSYVSGAVQLVFSVIVGAALIAILVMRNNEEVKNELGTSRRLFRYIWYILFANIAAFVSSILLFRAIKLNNTKIMSIFIGVVTAVMVGWTIVSILSLIHNTKATGSFGTAFVEFLIDMIYVVIEILIITPVSILCKQLKSERFNPMNPQEMQGLNQNGPYKPNFQS